MSASRAVGCPRNDRRRHRDGADRGPTVLGMAGKRSRLGQASDGRDQKHPIPDQTNPTRPNKSPTLTYAKTPTHNKRPT